jgi:CDP-diglyceride synthetase
MPMIRHSRLRRIPILSLTLVSLTLAACDPVVNIAGANFPAWLLCAIVGAVLAAAFRPGFVATRIEQYLGPLMLIYPCLAILVGCATYLIFFNRV